MHKFILLILIFLVEIFNTALGDDSYFNAMKSSSLKIASLPSTLYDPDLSFFERTPELAARYYSMATSFAQKNDINFVILTGVSYTSNEFALRRLELLHNEKIDLERFKNPKIIFIDSGKALQKLGIKRVTPEINKIFFDYSKIVGADIVLNSAIYASNQVNKTDDFVSFYDKAEVDESHKKPMESNICTIDIDAVWKNETLKMASKNNNPRSDAEIIKRINDIIINLAKNNKVDLVINGGYSKKICSMTNAVLASIDGDFK